MTADLRTMCRQRLRHLVSTVRRYPLDERAQDAALTLLVATASTIVLTSSYRTGFTHSYLLSVLCGLAAAASLVWRRSHPELCVAVAVVATFSSDEATALIAASYAVGLYGRGPRALVVGGSALAYVLTRTLTGEVLEDPTWRTYMVVLYTVLPAFYGHVVRRQRALKEQLQEQLSHARAATDHAARFAILEKRTRLAFEIHDTVGHHATFVVLRASGATRQPGLTPQAAEAFHDIQEGAILVMQELRRVIAVLRDDEEACLSGISCDEFLEGLARNMRAVGMDATYTVQGTVRALGARNESLLYRISREALTNAAKYAPGAPVALTLAFEKRSATLTVRNGPPLQRRPAGDSGGIGLHSMREAVAAVGGTFSAGPVPDGGYLIQAVITLPRGSTEKE